MKSLHKSMNQITKCQAIWIFKIGKTFKSHIFLFILTFGFLATNAQEPTPVPVAEPASQGVAVKPTYNRFALGMKVSHLYDLKYTAYDLLSAGVSASDPFGLNGSKTKIDMAVGLEASYFFGPMFNIDMAYEKGKMTGANKTEYYESSVSFLTLGANVNFKGSGRTKEYKLVPYFRASIARATYDADRKFIADDVIFSSVKGNSMQIGLGLGMRYHLNDRWSLNLMSEYVTIHSDAWDGYDYGTGKDQMLKSSLGLKYTFGRNKHVDRIPAWQDARVDNMQSHIDGQVDEAIKNLNDSVDAKFKKMMNVPGMKDSDDDGIVDKFDKCPDIAGLFSNNGCPPVEVPKPVETPAVKVEEKAKEAENNAAAAKESKTKEAIAPKAKETKTIETEKPISNTVSINTNNQPVASSGALTEDMVQRIKNEIVIDMNPIRFDYNSSNLNSKSNESLNTIALMLRNNPAYQLTLKGFTDNVGTEAYNKKLGEARANAVAKYLQSRGISKDRLTILSMGQESPLDDNTSTIGKANNRRVECKLK